MILLDTHVLLWLDRNDPALGRASREMVERAWQDNTVAICSISFWEVAMLRRRGRVELHQPIQSWRMEWLQAGLEELSLDGVRATLAADLEAFHADPADRFITATAVTTGATLLTADQGILGWSGRLQRHDARK